MSRWFRRLSWLAALTLVLLASAIYFSVTHAASDAAVELALESHLRFDYLTLADSPVSEAELIPAQPDFQDIATFNGRVYLTSSGGLQEFGSQAGATHTWRSGQELPPGGLGPVAVASLRATSQAPARELVIVVRGAGLLFFDGSTFHEFLPKTPALRRITCLLTLPTGRILFGTEAAGVYSFDGDVLTNFAPSLTSEHITALAGADQDLWIGTLDHGIWRIHGGESENVTQGLPDPQVLSAAVRGNTAWFGTPLGVAEFQSGRFTRTLAPGVFAKTLNATADSLQIGTEDEGLIEVASSTHNHALSGDAFPVTQPIQRLITLGAATYALTPSALFRNSGQGWSSITQPEHNLLTDRNVSALAVNSGGVVWVGYFDRGLDILPPNRQTFQHLEDDRLFCINRIAFDGATRTAVATANGLVLFGSFQDRQVLARKQGLMADHVTDVVFTKEGLIAATPAGLSFINRDGIRGMYVFHGLVNNHVYALGLAGNQLLAGTLGGVSVLNGETVRVNYTTANSGLKHNWITALAPVGDGWFAGTYGAGVMRLDGHGIWHTFPDLDGGVVVNPGAMLVANGRVYAGSLGRGLFICDLVSGRCRNSVAALPSLNVTALAASGSDVYVGTDNGVVRFQASSLR